MQRAASSQAHRFPYWLFSLLAVAVVLIVTFLLIAVFNMAWLWAYLLGVNTATLLLYGYDKAVSGSRGRRVPETVLHGVELLGGTPAAFVAQRLFHHKTRKGSYQASFWVIVLLQVLFVAVIWWLGWT